jgi:hypothetical protein
VSEEEQVCRYLLNGRERLEGGSVVDVEEARHETRASAVCDELVVTERIARDQRSSTLEEKGTVTRRVAGRMDDARTPRNLKHLVARECPRALDLGQLGPSTSQAVAEDPQDGRAPEVRN